MVQDIIWKADCHSACQKIFFLMEPEGSLPCPHKPTTGLYLSQLTPVLPIDPYLPKVHLNINLPPTSRSSQWSLPFGPPNQNPVNISTLPHACHMSRLPNLPWFLDAMLRSNKYEWDTLECCLWNTPRISANRVPWHKHVSFTHTQLKSQVTLEQF
jgi:hypothetical protein